MITEFKIFENYGNNGLQPFSDKIEKLFREFIELKIADDYKLYINTDQGIKIEDDDYDIFVFGDESQLDYGEYRNDHYFIGYMEVDDNHILDDCIILEKYILKEIRKHIDVYLDEGAMITLGESDILKLKDIQFDITDVKIEIESKKFNL
jgi:hypothetical protein